MSISTRHSRAKKEMEKNKATGGREREERREEEKERRFLFREQYEQVGEG